jgi:hypothetical protein
MSDQPMLDVALAYLKEFPNRCLFPIKAGAKYPPQIKNNLALASNDPEQIREWHAKWPNCNWGLSLFNDKSGVIVIDVDTKEGKAGQLSFDLLELEYGNFPTTERVRTPSGGFHLYYIGKHVFALGKYGFGEGIDSPGYVLIAGCRFKDGTSYELDDYSPAAAAPEWFYDVLSKAKKERVANASESAIELDLPDNVEWAKTFLTEDAEPAIEGKSGEATTFKVAASLRDMGISAEMALELMVEFYNERCVPPWERDGLNTKIVNAYNYASLSQAGAKSVQAEFIEPDDFTDADIQGDRAVIDRQRAARRKDAVATKKIEADRAALPEDQKEKLWTREEVIESYVWVVGIERFLRIGNNRSMWKKSAFDSAFAYLAGKGPKSMAEQLLKKSTGTVARFHDICFLPGRPQRVNGGTSFNTYTAPDLVPAEGDVAWWNEHLEYLFPDPEDRNMLLNWMAWLLQNLRLKPKHALLIQGDIQGTGKSFISDMLTAILHKNNVANINQNDLHGDFNGWATRSKLLVIEELRAVDRTEVANKLHPLITQETISVNEKNLPQREVDNCFGVFAMTNNDAAITIDASDRRYLVLRTDARPKSKPYYGALYARLSDPASVAAVAYSLMTRNVGEYDGRQSAPRTKAKEMMIEAGLSDLETHIIESKDEYPFNCRLTTVRDVIENLPKRLESGRSPRQQSIIRSIIFRNFPAIDMGTCPVPQDKGNKRRIIALKQGALLKDQPRGTVGSMYWTEKENASKGRPADLDDTAAGDGLDSAGDNE